MAELIRFELHKIFSKRLAKATLLFLLLFSVFLSFSTYLNMYAFDGKNREGTGKEAVEIDRSIAKKYEGILTDEKVQEMMSDFAPAYDLHGLNAAYLYQNSIQSALFTRFSDRNGNWNGVEISDVFGTEPVKIGYVNGWLHTSRNFAQIFLLLSLGVIAMTAPVFSGEYGGVDSIILTTKYGRTKCPAAKIYASLIVAVLVTVFLIAINLIMALIFYGRDGLDCSILFAPTEFTEYYIPFNITCKILLTYQILLAFTGVISVTGITLAFSSIFQNQMVTFISSAAVYLFPVLFPVLLPISETSPLYKLVVLLPVYHAQYISIMSVTQIEKDVLYAVFAVPAAFIFAGTGIFLSRRIFVRHQVT